MNCLHPKYDADIIVAPDTSPGFANSITRRQMANGKTQVHFAGPRYWFLRPEFKWRTQSPTGVNQIGIMMGGTDPNNIAYDLLLKFGAGNALIVAGNAAQVAYQMSLVDLMLVGCGLGFWESLAVGTPTIPFAANEQQATQYGSVFKLGTLENVKAMIQNGEWVEANLRYQIGEGQGEVIEEILR
jgi:spore coat polysaccharide biosynthesis predicted glycosyltransferase SpsG